MTNVPLLSVPSDGDGFLDLRGCSEGGTIIAERYEIQDCLGVGSTAAVLRALDRSSGVVVAVKIANATGNVHNRKIAREAELYRRIVSKASPALNLFPRMFGAGQHNDVSYVVFDLGGFNLFDVINMSCLHPLPKRHLREIIMQLLHGLCFLHSLQIVHTDIKPHNIVLRTSELHQTRRMRVDGFFVTKMELKSAELYIIDFGDAVIVHDRTTGIVGTNPYRAPEVTLGLPWTAAIDAFATGCVAAELYLGRPLFHYTDTDIERLALIERVLGSFPEDVAKNAERIQPGTFVLETPVHVVFPRPDVHCKAEVRRVMGAWPLSGLVFDVQYLDLCALLMTLDPLKRQDLRTILVLPFLQSSDDDMVLVEPWENHVLVSFPGV
ncbi:kinase-like protein [Polyporus arcularius HHB13444]|uniref:Kinase-like protein n=1 Tax=Polyporus arcularius HHB13444 TaxID=1314778 RepID=A0A5C3P6A6_9APHY|nr:kinase-like protein [Polyporus arcularius HHB13444]